jgi:hypothetical protein
MTSPTPESVTTEEALDNSLKLLSRLLSGLQELRLKRGLMGLEVFREKEKEFMGQISQFLEDYKVLSDQNYKESS